MNTGVRKEADEVSPEDVAVPNFWRPISTAPTEVYRSFTVDLWAVSEDGRHGQRFTECYHDKSGRWTNEHTVFASQAYGRLNGVGENAAFVTGDPIPGRITHWFQPAPPIQTERDCIDRDDPNAAAMFEAIAVIESAEKQAFQLMCTAAIRASNIVDLPSTDKGQEE